MENIISGHLNLGNLEHGTIKFNFVNNKVFFDSLFVQTFDLPYRFMNGVRVGDKTVLNNSDLHNLIKVIRKIKSDKSFRRFEYESVEGSKYLFVKRLIQLEQEYIYAYFIAPKFDEVAPGYEVSKNVVDLLTDISRTTYWYVDFSSGKKDYFSSSPLYGSEGKVIRSEDSIYFSKLDAAVEQNEEYRMLVDVVKKNVHDCETGALESFRVKYPMYVDDEIIWIETLAKVVSKDEKGNTLLLVGVDIIISDYEEVDLESELFSQVADVGLNNANVGVWLMTMKNDVKTFRYNAKLRELYRFDEHIISASGPKEEYDNSFTEAMNRVIDRFPEYKSFFDEDYILFNKALSGEIESYRSFLPFIDKNDKVVWMEVRGSVAATDEDGKVTTMTGVSIDITEHFETKIYERLFEKSQTAINTANKSAIDMMELLIWSIDYTQFPEGDYFYGNDQYIQKLGLVKNENGLVHIQDYFDSIIESDDYSIDLEDIGEYTNKIKSGEIDGFSGLILKHINRKTGEVLYGSHSSKVAQRDKNGKVLLLSGFFLDVTNEVRERRLRLELEESFGEIRKFNQLAIQAGELMVFNINYLKENKGREIYANDLFIEKLGIPTDDNHYSYETYVSTVMDDEEGRKLFDICDKTYLDVLKGNRHGVNNMLSKHKNLKTGEIFYMQHNSHVEERGADGRVVAIGGFLRDVTQDILNEKKIQYLAEMDSLTDVYNRNKFEEVVRETDLRQYTIILFDIDGLKLANDIYGHQVGDEVLIHFTRILKEEFDTPFTFRIGGDEFCVLINTLNEDEVTQKIKDVEDRMDQMVVHDSVQTGVSVGYEYIGLHPFEQAFMFAENQMYRRKLSSRSSRKSKTLDTLMVTLGEKTEETNEHCERLSFLAQETYKQMGFVRKAELYDIGLAAQLHDIGKITIPLEILNKKGKLTDEEYVTVKKHSEAGYKIVFNIISSDDIAEGVLYHHERFDGKGYPYRLKGQEIPLYARIISVCDAYDAMVSERPYSEAKTITDALTELKRCSGSQFDPEVVDAFIEVIEAEE